MTRLSSPLSKLKAHYEVVVVGSGYGGSIAASRVARATKPDGSKISVCLLERGKEFAAGDFPDNPVKGVGEMQFDLPRTRMGPRTGLYDFRVNRDINVVLGCGLGGTSLINANVSLPADGRVFDDACWPAELRGRSTLDRYYRLAEAMLKPASYPQHAPPLHKLEALENSARHVGKHDHFYRPPITVNFTTGTNHVGVHQNACVGCGDCCSGCNFAAKNTTAMNYLPDAHNHGAEIFTQISVRYLEQHSGHWQVHCERFERELDDAQSTPLIIEAETVILAAGTLGSTEILLRSQRKGLALSPTLGSGFTGNGDLIAFNYNSDTVMNAVGVGSVAPPSGNTAREPVGPTVAGIIDLRNSESLDDGFVIEDGAIPSPLAFSLPTAFAAAATFLGRGAGKGTGVLRARKREMQSLLLGAYKGAIRNTQVFLVMAHDNHDGEIYLDEKTDRVRVKWPGVGAKPVFRRINDFLARATKAAGGTYIKNPQWTKLMHQGLTTVHPLGGCIIAENIDGGVVNHKGQVFDANSDQGTTVYDGLYVCDGAIVPRSVGINPLLTISALAERNIALMADDRGWRIDYDLDVKPR